MSGKSRATSIICVADGVLASCSNESVIRFWDFDRGENYVLDLQQSAGARAEEEAVTCIGYNQEKGMWGELCFGGPLCVYFDV